MDLMKQTLRILPHQRDSVDHDGIGNDALQVRRKRVHYLRRYALGHATGQRQMEMEVVKDERVAPVQHLLILTGRQVRLAAAGDVRVAQRRAKRIKRSDRRCCKVAQCDLLIAGAQCDKAVFIAQRERTDIKGGVAGCKVCCGILQLRQVTFLGQIKRSFQRPVHPVFARGLRDRGDINAVHNKMRHSAALDAIPAQPLRAEFGQRASWRVKDGISFKHIIPPQMHSLCQLSVTTT